MFVDDFFISFSYSRASIGIFDRRLGGRPKKGCKRSFLIGPRGAGTNQRGRSGH